MDNITASPIVKAERRFALFGAVIAMSWNALFFYLWMGDGGFHNYKLKAGLYLSALPVGAFGYLSGRNIVRKIDQGVTTEKVGFLQGILCGALVGAINGSFIVPVIGTVIGAVLGIFIGAFSGWLAAYIAEWMANRAKRG